MENNGRTLRHTCLALAVAAAVAGASLLGGCGKRIPAQTPAQTQELSRPEGQSLPNPMKEVDGSRAFEEIGVYMELPKEASDPRFYIINNEVADVSFTYDGVECTYRASATAEDFDGIFEQFKDSVVKERAGNGAQKTDIEIKTTQSGGRLASWAWGSTKYTLYSPDPVGDDALAGLAVTLAGLGEAGRK